MNETMVSFEAEQSVIGACLLDNEVMDRVMFLKDTDFFVAAHKEMFKSIQKCHEEGKFLDPITMEQYVDNDIVTFDYICEVAKNTPSARNVVAYADRVKDMSNKRAAYNFMADAMEELKDHRTQSIDVVSRVSEFIDKSVLCSGDQKSMTVEDMISETLDEMEKSTNGIRVGIKSGIQEIDDRIGYKGLAFGEITALGALSKNGKTLTANSIIARADYQDNETCHVFSIEMPAVSMFNGIVSAMSGVPSDFYVKQDYYHKMYPGKYDNMMSRWGAAAHELNESNRVTIDGTKRVDMDYICANIRKQHALARQNGKILRLVVIDHAHQMEYPGAASTTEKMGEASRNLKATIAELDIAVVFLVQLNNSCEGKDPTSFHILDTSRIRHNLQAFIGTRLFRENGGTYIGVYGDAQRYGDQHTLHHPAYMKLVGGVLRSLPEEEKNWVPSPENNN